MKSLKSLVLSTLLILIGFIVVNVYKVNVNRISGVVEQNKISFIEKFEKDNYDSFLCYGDIYIEFNNGSYALINTLENKYLFKCIDNDTYNETNNINKIIETIAIYTNKDTKEIIDILELEKEISKEKEVLNKNTNEYLNNYASEFLKNEFDMILDIPLVFAELGEDINGRIKFNEYIAIDNSLKNDNTRKLEKVLIHELLHYYLYESGNSNYIDGSREFESMIRVYNSISNYDESQVNSLLNGDIQQIY